MMSTQTTQTSVRASIAVEAPVERAFTFFLEGIGDWWPLGAHLLGKASELRCEPRVGGRIYEHDSEGNECSWARVLAYEPPNRLVISWDLRPDWQVATDYGMTSEIEVQFVSEAPGRTRLELEHRNLERHGKGWETMRDAVSSDGGWPGFLRRYAEQLTAAK
jgi:uncharacterized protein YndB with AHSA1/START domain